MIWWLVIYFAGFFVSGVTTLFWAAYDNAKNVALGKPDQSCSVGESIVISVTAAIFWPLVALGLLFVYPYDKFSDLGTKAGKEIKEKNSTPSV